MNLRLRESPWRLMLAVNAAVLIGVFWHKITLPPFVPYIHLLVDYHFGFTKRALIGAIVGVFAAKVPVWLVFAVGGAVLGRARSDPSHSSPDVCADHRRHRGAALLSCAGRGPAKRSHLHRPAR